MLLVLALDRPSRRASEALLATFADVTFFAISKALTRPLAGVLWGLFQVPVIQRLSYSNVRTTIKIMPKRQLNYQNGYLAPNFHNKIAILCYFIVKIRKLSLPLHTTTRQLTRHDTGTEIQELFVIPGRGRV